MGIKTCEVSEELKRITTILTDAQKDAEKFDKGNKAAGVRVRKALLDTKNDCHQLRQVISAFKK